MARHTGPVCKLCRREGQKLFLKGTRCYTEKCAIERRGYPPGVHGRMAGRRRKQSEYATQLREKQKVKRIYGVLETQFENYFDKSAHTPGVTGENLLIMLERRLDNVVYRLGLAPSRKGARQLVRHRHILVNGRVVDVPSYQVSPGERIQVKEKSREMPLILGSIESRGKEGTLPWLEVDFKSQSGRMVELPTRETIPIAAEEQLIVELYSK
ncbi:MAG TPA: 30S ribosomal protein S4 [Gemmatimonadota bacterium]|nr:30S ribosomal protein S4 [Gemmatimonadota bacterium]